MKDDISSLHSLGSKETEYKTQGPSVDMLEMFPNHFPGNNYIIDLVTSEHTSLCPRTGQPDFATICISYMPDQRCIETKSLKLYLFAYRNEGTFMETQTNNILNDLVQACQPKWMRVVAEFVSRGGIKLTVTAEYGERV